jgi:hypothetical protein
MPRRHRSRCHFHVARGESGDEQALDGLPELMIDGLPADEARQLLDARSAGRSTNGRRHGSSERPAATRSHSSSCRAG